MDKRLIIFLVSSVYLYGAVDESKYTYYGGVHFNCVAISGFTNFHLSDWVTSGLKSDDSINPEGRVHVPLGEQSGGNVAGIFFGTDFPMSNRINEN